jgi:hypothetical protein
LAWERVAGGRRREGCIRKGGSLGNTKGSEAGEQGGDVAGIGDSEGAVGTVVGKGETEKRRGDGVGFYVV